MGRWQAFRVKINQSWYSWERRRLLITIVAGLSLILGLGIGMYRNWPVEEQPPVV
ncbi:MAG: hypothetical protein GX956_10965, partial [Firmicutes bacterium]|nr:hypothetical protein [Bacillota bacterium]